MSTDEPVRCVICSSFCDESGLCDDHKYDEQIKPDMTQYTQQEQVIANAWVAGYLSSDKSLEEAENDKAQSVKQYGSEIESIVAEEVLKARADEINRICDEVGLFTKKRNKFVYNVQLSIKYLIDRVTALKEVKR